MRAPALLQQLLRPPDRARRVIQPPALPAPEIAYRAFRPVRMRSAAKCPRSAAVGQVRNELRGTV